MKTLIPLFIFLFGFIGIKAQSDTINKKGNNKFIISIAGGRAKPVGVFSKFETMNTTADNNPNIAGVPNIGYYGKLEFRFNYSKHIGASAMYSYSNNKVRQPSQTELGISSSGGGLGGGYSENMTNYNSGNWNTNSFLIGLYTTFSDRLVTFNLKFSVGAQQVKIPTTDLVELESEWWMSLGTVSSGTTETIQPGMKSINLVVNAGIDFNLRITKRIGITIGAEDFSSQASFTGTQTFINNYTGIHPITTTPESQGNIHFSKDIYLFCFNAGISYVIK